MLPNVETMAEAADETVAPDVGAAHGDPTGPALVESVDGAMTLEEPAAPPIESDAPLAAEEPEEGHEGGSGGQGNPYRMTFTVVWLDPNGTPIDDLDAVLPDYWRDFELVAISTTGKSMTTSATCTYPDGSDVLQCVFENRGHGLVTDGLIIPARPTATYTVTVNWPTTGWTIDGANADSYSARDLCPRGGGGEEGGGGHEGGGEEGGGAVYCEHVVELQQIPMAVVPPTVPPAVEPEAGAIPPVVTPPVVTPPAATQTQPAVASAAPRSLPATGSSSSMILLIAALLVAIGSVAAGVTRRTS